MRTRCSSAGLITNWLSQLESRRHEPLLGDPCGCTGTKPCAILPCFPRPHTGSQIRNEVVRTRTIIHEECWHCNWNLSVLCHSTHPRNNLFFGLCCPSSEISSAALPGSEGRKNSSYPKISGFYYLFRRAGRSGSDFLLTVKPTDQPYNQGVLVLTCCPITSINGCLSQSTSAWRRVSHLAETPGFSELLC